VIVFSMHALHRMHERGVARGDVLDVIRDPEYTYTRKSPDDRAGTTYVGEDLVVVTEDPRDGLERRIITVTPREMGSQTSRPLNAG